MATSQSPVAPGLSVGSMVSVCDHEEHKSLERDGFYDDHVQESMDVCRRVCGWAWRAASSIDVSKDRDKNKTTQCRALGTTQNLSIFVVQAAMS